MNEIEIKELVTYLLKGDEVNSWNLIQKYIKGKESTFLYENIVTRAMRYVGELWEMNEISVADEHVASNIFHLLISRFSLERNGEERADHLGSDSRSKAMLFCIEGEEHSLGAKMASSLFEEYDWDTRYLGANLPINDAIIYANKWRPDVIGISVSIVYNLPILLEFLKEIDRLDYDPEIILGGRITILYPMEKYCPDHVVILKDLHSLRYLLDENKLCKPAHVIS